jgi:hypothetical protein
MSRFPIIFSGDQPNKWLVARTELNKLFVKENCVEIFTENPPRPVDNVDQPVLMQVDRNNYEPENNSEFINSYGTRNSTITSNDGETNELRTRRKTYNQYLKDKKMFEDDYLNRIKIWQQIDDSNRKEQQKWQTKVSKAFKILDESLGIVAKSYVSKEFKKLDPKAIYEKLEEMFMSRNTNMDISNLLTQITNIRIIRQLSEQVQ